MELTNRNILITGGAGAIGGMLLKSLLKKKCRAIIVLDDLSSGLQENVPVHPSIKFFKGSVSEDGDLEKIFNLEPEIIFHLAANFANQQSIDCPQRDLLVNGLGTLKLLEYSSKSKIVKKFTYTSSSCVYGNRKEACRVTNCDYSVDTPYAITKLLGERYTTFFETYCELPTVILRLFNSFGPGERPGRYRNVIPNFIWRAINNEPLIITGQGTETRDFNYIDNVINGLISATESEKTAGRIYNIGSGKETRIIDLARLINEIAGNKAGLKFIDQRKWDKVQYRLADITEAERDFGYKPVVDLKHQLNISYQWFKEGGIKPLH